MIDSPIAKSMLGGKSISVESSLPRRKFETDLQYATRVARQKKLDEEKAKEEQARAEAPVLAEAREKKRIEDMKATLARTTDPQLRANLEKSIAESEKLLVDPEARAEAQAGVSKKLVEEREKFSMSENERIALQDAIARGEYGANLKDPTGMVRARREFLRQRRENDPFTPIMNVITKVTDLMVNAGIGVAKTYAKGLGIPDSVINTAEKVFKEEIQPRTTGALLKDYR
jgi:hypothetical protein